MDLPDFSGTWGLDPAASDNPKKRLAQASELAQDTIEDSWVDQQSRASDLARDVLVQIEGELAEFGRSAATLHIRHADPEFRIRADADPERVLYTDNRGGRVSTTSSSNRQPITTAGWEGSDLVVETTTDRGLTVLERYSLLANGKQLRLVTSVQPARLLEPMVITRVYDAASKPPE